MSAAAKEQEQAGRRIEELLEALDRTAGPEARDTADELVRALVEFYGQGLSRIVELLESADPGTPPVDVLTRDELVCGLLVLHDLHPEDTMTRVERALDEVRPYLGSHAGDVEITGLDPGTGILRLRLRGSCDGCPSSAQTVRWTIEGAVARAAPEVAGVEVEGVEEQQPGEPALLQIASRPPDPAGPPPPAATVATHRGGEADWLTLDGLPRLAVGGSTVHRAAGVPLFLVRLASGLYAYRDHCPVCAGTVHDGALDGERLRCAQCAAEYDIHRAGRGGRGHLEPVPLLEEDDGVRVALPGVPAGAGS
ncbi:NifU family protein [Streptomyces sp. NPDC002055]|uniref:NifU family protein n=1 Tax=Streptomyces sp. NPDC002055 TaxID=3154534 RepID=UPI00332A8F15